MTTPALAPRPDARIPRRSGTAAARRSSTLAFYDFHCESYADATLSLDTSSAVSRFAALLPPGGAVLDAGCGSGRDLTRLHAAGLRPVGLDVSARLAAIARRNSGLTVIEGDLRTPPFAPESFDGVWAMASLLHIEQAETRRALTALTALLRTGGILFTSVKQGRGRMRDGTGRWFTLHDAASWRVHLEKAGLEVLELNREAADSAEADGSRPGWISSLARKV